MSPQSGNALYFEFIGSGGNAGYLNAMEIIINSSGPNSPPVAANGSYAMVQGGQVMIATTELAIDPDGDAATFASIDDPNGDDAMPRGRPMRDRFRKP